jgi:hypothetical protein
MKTRNWVFGILAVALLAESGCGRRQQAPQATAINGVQVDLAKFQRTFGGAGPGVQASAARVSKAVRYGRYAEGVAELERLVANPDLTEPQKSTAADVLDQLNQVISRSEAKPPQ